MKIKLFFIFFLLFLVLNQANAEDQMTVNIIGKIRMPELKTEAIKIESNNKLDHGSSINSMSLKDEKVVFNSKNHDAGRGREIFVSDSNKSSVVKEKAVIELNRIIRILEQNLEKRGYAVSKGETDISIVLTSDGLYYDSISGESLNSIDYSIQKNGKEIFSGNFEQTKDCNRLFGFLKCENKSIAKILLKKILKDINSGDTILN